MNVLPHTALAKAVEDRFNLIGVTFGGAGFQLGLSVRCDNILVRLRRGNGLRVVLSPGPVIGPHTVQGQAVLFDGLEIGHDGVAFHLG